MFSQWVIAVSSSYEQQKYRPLVILKLYDIATFLDLKTFLFLCQQ